MNLTKLALFSCPAVVAALVLITSPAQASTPANLLQQPSLVEFTTDHHAITITVVFPAERPLLPTGCSCARCIKAEELLQGQFPAF